MHSIKHEAGVAMARWDGPAEDTGWNGEALRPHSKKCSYLKSDTEQDAR